MLWNKKLASSILAAGLLLFPFAQTGFAATVEQDSDALVKAYQEVLKHYSKPDQDKLLQAAVQGMLQTLNDPFSNYMSPEEYQRLLEAINQTFAGVGVSSQADSEGRGVVINRVFAGSPAEQAGILPGDLLVKVNGQSAPDGKPEALLESVRGPEGTSVELTLERKGQSYTVNVVRKQIHLPLAEWQDLGDGISYISISSFSEATTGEFKTALDKAVSSKAKGLVIDLRDNGGGTVLSALQIADLFLKEGTLLIVHDEQGNEQPIIADSEGNDLPLVVLVDKNTASASEILAGALQKNHRATLVGTTTFGKGTMQVPVELANGAYLKISVDRWELPDGTSNDKVGIRPDIQLNRPDAVLNAAKQVLLPDRTEELKLSRNGGTGRLNGQIDLTGVPAPFFDGGLTYLPLRYTVESFGSEVGWSEGKVTFKLGGHHVAISVSDSVITVDGKSNPTPDAVRVVDGATYVSSDTWSQWTGHAVQVGSEDITVFSK